MHKRAIRLVAGTGRLSRISPVFCELEILKTPDLLKYHVIRFVLHDILWGNLPLIISSKFALFDRNRATRRNQHFNETVYYVNQWSCRTKLSSL